MDIDGFCSHLYSLRIQSASYIFTEISCIHQSYSVYVYLMYFILKQKIFSYGLSSSDCISMLFGTNKKLITRTNKRLYIHVADVANQFALGAVVFHPAGCLQMQ